MTFSEYAKTWIGTKQGTQKHKQIIDGYNTIKPLPRGYRLTYSDSWCAGFASFVMLKCGAVNAPYECSCYYMKQAATKNKQIVKTPKINDFVLYDWGGDGVPDHIGVISNISGDKITVIEGNMSRAVGVRTISKKSGYINCYIRVSQKTGATPTTENLDSIAKKVIRGDYGNGDERKQRLTAAGYDYNAVQKRVNELLK